MQLGAHGFNVTVEHREDQLENSGLLGAPIQDRTLASLALGYGWRNAGRALQVNVRHDEESDFGSATTGTRERMAMLAARNVQAVLSGGEPITPVLPRG